ncbi:MAG TPA: DUF5317 family protein [Candidatus Paceibacterota bacterium]|nr:DUF5317 family protein [Candidatus Paceibacterota bacterium]
MGLVLMLFYFLSRVAVLATVATYVITARGRSLFRRPHGEEYWLRWALFYILLTAVEWMYDIPQGWEGLIRKGALTVLLVMSFRLIAPVVIFLTGIIANALATGLNGLSMPVLVMEGVEALLANCTGCHHAMNAGTRVPLLCDIFPAFVEGNLIAMFSIGDLLLSCGILWFLISVIRDRPEKAV